jgi:hypothetical protein
VKAIYPAHRAGGGTAARVTSANPGEVPVLARLPRSFGSNDDQLI